MAEVTSLVPKEWSIARPVAMAAYPVRLQCDPSATPSLCRLGHCGGSATTRSESCLVHNGGACARCGICQLGQVVMIGGSDGVRD